MNNSVKILSLTLILFVITSLGACAQHSHSHSHDSPNGGVLKENNGYHVEMVKKGDILNFYLFDGNLKPVNDGSSAQVEFEFSSGTKTSSDLRKGEKNLFSVALPKANIVEYFTVTVSVNGKTVTVKFKNSVSEADRQHGHQH